MKLFKNNQDERRPLPKIKHFLTKMVQMRGCFLTKCINDIHEDKNIKQMIRYSQETGRSMVEMLGVLAIIGVLSVGGIAGYSKAMYKQKMNKTVDIVSKVLMGINEWSLKSLHIDGPGMTNRYAIQLGILDQSLCETQGTYSECRLPIGGKMEVGDKSFSISLRGETNRKNICVDFLSQHWETALPANYDYIATLTYNGEFKYVYSTNTDIEVKTSYTLTDIEVACNQACSGDCSIYLGNKSSN